MKKFIRDMYDASALMHHLLLVKVDDTYVVVVMIQTIVNIAINCKSISR